ncbi:hypothetical protein CL619_02500 [archaeon]|nr:hypothetical protein [archaeon]|tara:strand:- start:3516 stop:4160 length:645 start_codon:yes stop_codon:yes gene_type:complete
MTEENNSKKLLEQRNSLRKPAFVVKESNFKAGVKPNWRKPRGKHSPVRQYHKGRIRMPTPGYGAPKEVYGLTRDGKKPVFVQRIGDLDKVNARTDVVVIGSTVGLRKRLSLLKVCREKGLILAGPSDLKKELSTRDRQFADSKKITNARRKEKQTKVKSEAKAKKDDKKDDKKEVKKEEKVNEKVEAKSNPETTAKLEGTVKSESKSKLENKEN